MNWAGIISLVLLSCITLTVNAAAVPPTRENGQDSTTVVAESSSTPTTDLPTTISLENDMSTESTEPSSTPTTSPPITTPTDTTTVAPTTTTTDAPVTTALQDETNVPSNTNAQLLENLLNNPSIENNLVETPAILINVGGSYDPSDLVPILVLRTDEGITAPEFPPCAYKSSFHSQDELGGYIFGYTEYEGPSSRIETRDHSGVVRGAFKFRNADGFIQDMTYVAGKGVGYSPVSSNFLPQPTEDTQEVIDAKDKFFAAFNEAKNSGVGASPLRRKRNVLAVQPIQYTSVGAVANPADLINQPVISSYRLQDEAGSYSFGYAGGPTAREETRNHLGHVTGSYHYIDPTNEVQSAYYTADASGYKVSATNLPVAPGASAQIEKVSELRSALIEAHNQAVLRQTTL